MEIIMSETKNSKGLLFTVKQESSMGDVYFNVAKYEKPITKDYLEKLLKNFPVYFRITKLNMNQTKPVTCSRYEPIENVEKISLNVEINITPAMFHVLIYPTRCNEVIFKIEVLPKYIDEKPEKTLISLLNLANPGNGQIATSFYSRYENFNINCPLSKKDLSSHFCSENIKEGINFEIYSYHPVYQKEFKLMENFFFGASKLQSLLNLIAGGEEEKLTVTKIDYWKDLIFYAVKNMRFAYEGPFGFVENDETRLYYLETWKKIENIERGYADLKDGSDINKHLVVCLEELRHKILWK